VDVSLAESILDETSVDIQTQGLHCNTEINYPLTANVNGEIIVPTNCVRIDTTETSADIDVTQRGNKLYDRGERSYTSFTGTLRVEMVLLLDFEDLPQHVRRYSTVKAARRFQGRYIGSESLGGFTEIDEREAMVQFERAEKLNEDNNILSDNFDTYKILSRGSPRRAVRF
jgi:hypothetical protein